VGLERGPLSLVSTTEKLFDRKAAAPVYKTENTALGLRHADNVAPSIRKSWQSLRWQRRSLARYSSLADSDHGVFLCVAILITLSVIRANLMDKSHKPKVTSRLLTHLLKVNWQKVNSVALVRERTIPTEWPPLVGEVSARFCGLRGVTRSTQRVPKAVFSVF
jgi:hypothetical protein